MLVLSRRIFEEIVINGNIRIRIANLTDRNVKLAIAAPEDVLICRGEVVSKERPPAKRRQQGRSRHRGPGGS